MDILSSILAEKISVGSDKQSDFERVYWFSRLLKWIQRPRAQDEKDLNIEKIYTTRIKYLNYLLNKNPEWKAHFVTTVQHLLLKLIQPSQLCHVGFSEATSFSQDLIYRVQEKILPRKPLSESLDTLVQEVFSDPDESLYVDMIDLEILKELIQFFNEDQIFLNSLQQHILAACYYLSHQILQSTYQIQNQFSTLSSLHEDLYEFQIQSYLQDCFQNKKYHLDENILLAVDSAEKHLDYQYAELKAAGIKIESVYLIQLQRRRWNRLKILLRFLTVFKQELEFKKMANIRLFISSLILEVHHQNSLISFINENLSLLTEKIIQANTHIGEHYVTFSWIDFKKMFYSSLGGGAVTALTVHLKFFLTQLKLTGFIKGFFESINYSGSFLFIQSMGWTLATKQPSTTALYIASALKKSTTEARKAIVALLRTQFIAVIGNLSFVFPICFIVSWVLLLFKMPLMSAEEVHYQLNSTAALGPSFLYAAFTGCLLFLGSLMAGWFENWFLVNRLDKRIKYNPVFQRFFGRQKVKNLAQFLTDNTNAIAANISLGFLLGMVPQVAKFMGLPIEVRHVTLATGGFASALPLAVHGGTSGLKILDAALGLILIGVMNISISFALAFTLASVYSRVRFQTLWVILKWGLRLVFTKPWLLVIPEDSSESQADEDNI